MLKSCYTSRSSALALLLCTTAALTLSAQETINNASLNGRVTDPTGAMVRNAAVTATASSTGVSFKATTDTAGRFHFPYLQVGQYQVVVHADGFGDVKQNLTLTIGAAFDLPVKLAVGGATQAVNVNAEAPIIETDRSQIADTISQNEVANLPYNGRNFLDLALLVPGVSPTNTAANQLFAETSAVSGQGISVSSQHNFSNSFIVDGLSANDDAAGLVQTSFGLDVVREMQVVTSGGQAEFGRALGGYINFVSKSGGNQIHGDVYGYLRDKQLNAYNPYSHLQLPYTQTQSGASLGGPIVRDRTFYFANYEHRQLNQTGTISIKAADAAAIDAILAADKYPGQSLNIAPSSFTVYPNPVRQENFFVKADHQVNQRDQLSLRYSLYHVSSVNSRGVAGTSYTSAGANLTDLDQTVAVSNVFTIDPRTVNETRGQFTNSNLLAPPTDTVGPAVSISGSASFGTLSGSPTGRYDRLYEVVDNLSHQVGAHSLRVGVDFLFNDLKITFPMSNRGSYTFGCLFDKASEAYAGYSGSYCTSSFYSGVYTTFAQTFGNFVVPQTNPNFGLYVQDEWKATSKLTINAGVRYDLQWLKAVSTDTNNISPRIGFAYSPYKNRGTVIRGSFGLFYDRVPLRALSNALESDQNTTAITANTLGSLSLSYGQTGAPIFPAITTGYTALNLPSTLRLNLSTMDPNMKNAYSEQSSLEVDQQITRTSNLAISYQHLRGLDILLDINLNTPTCYATQPKTGPLYPVVDPINLCRPNPNYGNNKQYYPGADSYYDALTVSYVQRPVKYGSYRISYTWSKAIDDVSEFFFSSPVNNYNFREDRSLSDDDQRHRVVFDATLHSSLERAGSRLDHITHGWLLSDVLTYYSPFPFNITTGQNSIQTTGLRPCLPGYTLTPNATNTCANAAPGTMIGRNAGVGFSSFTMNTRLSRTFPIGERFRLQGIAEAFNALNHRNDLFPTGTFGTGTYPTAPASTFGTPTAAGDPRSIEFAAKLSF
ncbi:Carboxypeptidase regulatory-like domain-containing protein [Granulicella rosea]|uniref:Carboxypeptidase regulatory-like domain-containing protein n=1 Tax=Granulicella rosea TaxID=474952 RepID=A0A239KQE8_9BACT|nr:carboxypeptidase regulatory-like domain-containing protein [Granulicella rosea]SNT19414.1 Carboxypeptidase regulatory-like domain-containing protein [Granulicella rosea]